jgi:hypothetical protein
MRGDCVITRKKLTIRRHVHCSSEQSAGVSVFESKVPVLQFDLLADGYITRSFGLIKAERYLFNLLKTNKSGLKQLCRTIPSPDGSLAAFVVEAVATKDSPRPFMQDRSGRPLWLLDYSIPKTGTVVPQELWSPRNVNDYTQYVVEQELQMPIFFTQENGILGLPLDDAMNGRYQTLRDARMQAHLGGKSTAHIRIKVCSCRSGATVESALTVLGKWPEYCDFKHQVQIRDETAAHNPITIGKFAHLIGRSVNAFIRVSVLYLDCAQSEFRHDGGRCRIRVVMHSMNAGCLGHAG